MRCHLTICLVGLTLLALGCVDGEVVSMPRELQGTWWTSARGYEDRYLELSTLQVRFGTGGDTSTVHDIVEVRRMSRYTFEYRVSYRVGPDGENWLSFNYDPRRHSFRLVNQPHLEWFPETEEEG